MMELIAYGKFQQAVITSYDQGKLDLSLLDKLAREFAEMDMTDWGTSELTAQDGKNLEDICIEVVDPQWVPVKNNKKGFYRDPRFWECDERYWKWEKIMRERWQWSCE